MSSPVELLTVTAGPSKGRWRWWRALQVVAFTPKGARHSTYEHPLANDKNTEQGALDLALKLHHEGKARRR